jgi:DUF4097 and DUF4098 domain-containing protein YvlB
VNDNGQRRSPLFAGVLLILLGLVFLANRFNPDLGLGHLIRLYWPVLIILWGVAKLVEHFSAKKSGDPHGPLLSGAEAALLIILAIVLGMFVFRDWLHNEFPGIEIHLPAMGRSFTRNQSIPPIDIAAGAHIAIDTANGDIKVTGIEGNELRVTAHSSASGGSESATDERLKTVNAVIDRTGDGYRVHPINQSGGRSATTVDFEIQVPRTAMVTAMTSRGDISTNGIAGGLDARTPIGDIRVQDTGANVSADTQKGDVRITDVHGNVLVHGNGDDVEVASVTGDVTIDGGFLGDTKVNKAAGTLRIKSSRADITLAQLAGELTLDSGDLSITGAGGSIQIATRDKDISIQNATGRLDIADSHGDVTVRFAKPPTADISITNDSGDVSLTLPAESAFQISAESRSGEVECDFENSSFNRARETTSERINGVFGTPLRGTAPKISIATSYGTIHVEKSK